MINILLYFSSGLIICCYISYFVLLMIGRNKIVSKTNSFYIIKDIISEYNSINIIESKNYFSFYNIKRKVIKLDTRCYYGKDLSSICLALIEAGISAVDNNKNKYVDIYRNVFSNLKILYIFPLIALFISNFSFSINDAMISIFFIILFSIITYIFIDIKSQACIWINNNLKKIKDISKNSRIEVINYINRLILLDKFIFLGELIIIIRLMVILLKIN